MSKHQHLEGISSGARLTHPCQADGYIRSQLAATDRKIAHCMSESKHPPENLLADPARLFDVRTDELPGVNGSRRRANVSAINPRQERFMRLIEAREPKPRPQLPGLVDTFIVAAEHGDKS